MPTQMSTWGLHPVGLLLLNKTVNTVTEYYIITTLMHILYVTSSYLLSPGASHTQVKTRSLVTITKALVADRVAGGSSAPLVFSE